MWLASGVVVALLFVSIVLKFCCLFTLYINTLSHFSQWHTNHQRENLIFIFRSFVLFFFFLCCISNNSDPFRSMHTRLQPKGRVKIHKKKKQNQHQQTNDCNRANNNNNKKMRSDFRNSLLI